MGNRMTAMIVASIAIALFAFGLAFLEGYLGAREMAGTVEATRSTWNNDSRE